MKIFARLNRSSKRESMLFASNIQGTQKTRTKQKNMDANIVA